MRHGSSSSRRSRNRGHGGNGGNGGGNGNRGMSNRAQVFDSNGPDVRIRGTAFQIQEKYMALAKDAASGGDRVLSESYLQHAEHYQRLINEWTAQNQRFESQRFETGRTETDQPGDGFDRSLTPGSGEQPFVAPAPMPKKSGEDLGLPSSILGPKREILNPEMTEA